MRAEAQDHIDTITAALALLRRFLDWDRAVRRLDELNAKVEDPTLWNNPKAAQDVMRERRRLDEAITATRAIEKEMADTAELIELAEMEGDDALVDDAVASLAALAARLAPAQDPAGVDVKARLRRHTDAALARGVFGVPSIELDGRLYWGFDALAMIDAALRGDPWFASGAWEREGAPRRGLRRG